MTFDRVRFALERAGFTEIAEAGYEDGIFRVEGRNRNGEYVRLVVDAYTGDVIYERIVSSFQDPWSREFDDFPVVRRQLAKDQYTNIQSVRVEDDFILVDAENRHGDEVRLMVDRRTKEERGKKKEERRKRRAAGACVTLLFALCSFLFSRFSA
jgi:hypothetical protein